MVISRSWGVRIQVMCAWHLEQSVRIKRLLLKCLLPSSSTPIPARSVLGGVPATAVSLGPRVGSAAPGLGHTFTSSLRESEHWRPGRGLKPPCAGPALRSPALPGSPGSARDCRLSQSSHQAPGPARVMLRAGSGKGHSRFRAGLPYLPLLAQSGVMGTAA